MSSLAVVSVYSSTAKIPETGGPLQQCILRSCLVESRVHEYLLLRLSPTNVHVSVYLRVALYGMSVVRPIDKFPTDQNKVKCHQIKVKFFPRCC